MSGLVSEFCTKVANLCRAFQSFCVETAQWRRPGASSVYLLATNALFWACVFYGEQFYQFSFLCGLSTLLFVNNVLYPSSQLCISTTKEALSFPEHYDTFHKLATKEKIAACLKFVVTLPFYAVILPIFNVIGWIVMEKFVEYILMITSAVAAGLLKFGEIEKACWISYLSILFLLSVPPWRYNHITEQATEYVQSTCSSVGRSVYDKVLVPCSSTALVVLGFLQYYCLGYWIPPLLRKIKICLINCKNYFHRTIVVPIGRFLHAVKSAFVYVVFGYWIPQLLSYIGEKFDQLRCYLVRTIVDPVRRFYCRLKAIFIYWFCGHWVPPLVEYVQRKFDDFKRYVDCKIVQPFVRKVITVKNFLVYWFGGYWIPSFKQWCYDCKTRAILGFHRKIIDPIVDFFSNFTENMMYILLGRWIPGFIKYLQRKWIEPTVNFCIRCKNGFIYCIYGYWIPDFKEFLRRKKLELICYVRGNYIEPFKALICRTALRMKIWIIETKNDIKRYVIAKSIQLKNWINEKKRQIRIYVIETRRKVQIYLLYEVWIPFKKACRRSWIRFKFIVKYRIVYPAIRNSALFVIYSIEWTVVNVASPLFAFLYEQSVHFCGYFWYYYGDPCWHWVSQRLPEKSPFVDDSDTELKDYLPSGENDDNESESEEEILVEQRNNHPSADISRSPSSSSLEEAEFSRHMEIPALDQADSDEEQEQAMIPRNTLSISDGSKQQPTKKLPMTKNKPTMQRDKTSPLSPVRDLTEVLTNAASYAMLKATVGASFVSSQMSSIMSGAGYSDEENAFAAELERELNGSGGRRNGDDAAAFEADLEPDFEVVDHSDVDD